MLSFILTMVLSTWAIWILGHMLLMFFVRPDVPHFNGFSIHIPQSYRDRLTPDEIVALYLHECGHRHHLHVWKNLLKISFFCRSSESTRYQQELEADDYAAKHTDPRDLASALRKLSFSAADNVRARRLEMKVEGQS